MISRKHCIFNQTVSGQWTVTDNMASISLIASVIKLLVVSLQVCGMYLSTLILPLFAWLFHRV